MNAVHLFRTLRLPLVLGSLWLLPTAAWSDPSFTARARVVNVEPEYEWVRVPVRRCHRPFEEDEALAEGDEDRDLLPMIVGGALGGALGHQVGGGRGKDVATVAGAIAGTLIGHEWSEDDHVAWRPRHRRPCRPGRRWVERRQQVGYLVKYRFAGRTFTTHTGHDPGRWLEIRVRLHPVE